ncbi:MAG: hypothetical protein KGZ86_01325 [Candidatus Latescibacteria bacterium]|nr:hypothetical protein [Candidatus Latescibacterota bacterium]
MNSKHWTKQEVLDLLNKKESELSKEIEIDEDNGLIGFTIKLPFKINFNQGHWKMFFKNEEDVWKKFQEDESFFGITGLFEKELSSFLENLYSQTGKTKEDIFIEKEERMYEYDRQKDCRIIQNGVQVDVSIRCKTVNEVSKVINILENTILI